jgi:acetylornithine deacetylase/succinyl-diaminopimelate desuccinylase-like protein
VKRFVVAAALVLPLTWACARKPAGTNHRPTEFADVKRPAEEWLREEPIRLLRDYVRFDTTAAHTEEEGAEFLRRFFECEEIESEVVCPAPGRCNVVARLPGRKRENALLLLNHIDVVEAYAPYWKDAAPFEGTIFNGYLYGRGVYDMKSLAMAQMIAMARLHRKGIVPDSDILFLAEADEEIGQKWGARWMLEHRPEFFANVGQVLNEGGTTEVLLRDPVFFGLETLQAGYALAEFEAVEDAPLKALAARHAKLQGPTVEPHPHVVLGFDMLANRLPSPLTDPLRHLDRVRNNPAELAILPNRYGSFLEPRLDWSGTYHHPERPREVRIYVAIYVPPGLRPDGYIQPILEDARRSGLPVKALTVGEASLASPYPTPFTDLLKRVTEAWYPGVPFGPMPSYGGYTTSILLRERGIPTYGYLPIVMNITDSARRHGNDERVFLRDYLNGVNLYSDVVEEFALSPPSPAASGPAKDVTRAGAR